MISYGFLSMVLAIFFEGMILYVLDRHVGIKIYRWWYGLTHKNPLPSDKDRGFIYERRANARFTFAMTLILIQNGLIVWRGFVNPLSTIVSIPFEVVAILIGFYAGPFLNGLWERKDPILEVVDRIESGETSIPYEAKKVWESTVHREESATDASTESKTVETADARPNPKSEEKGEDPRAMINKFLGKQ